MKEDDEDIQPLFEPEDTNHLDLATMTKLETALDAAKKFDKGIYVNKPQAESSSVAYTLDDQKRNKSLKVSSKLGSSAFLNVGRKAHKIKKIYNDEIQYRPKYDLIHKSSGGVPTYRGTDATDIPFHDSRFDIFYY